MFLSNSQVLINDEIEGMSSENLGIALGLSEDGSTIAVGGSGAFSFSGVVRVYEDINGSWQQIGNDIIGENISDLSGRALDLSQDGLVLAIGSPANDSDTGILDYNSGHVRVYRNEGGEWVQIGQDIDGEAEIDNSGNAVALSADGSIVIVAASLNDGGGNVSGHARVFRNEGNNWVQIGEDLDGEAANDFFGQAVSISYDGSIIAVGANGNDGKGYVKIYQNENDNWVQIGEKLEGDNLNDNFGNALSFSSNGSILVVGTAVTSFGQDGYSKVFKNENDNWTQLGETIFGNANEFFGYDVDISSSGDAIVIGGIGDQDDIPGYAKIYKNTNGEWNQIGNDIPGEFNGDSSSNVSISGDGTRFGLGGAGHSAFNGHVRVFETGVPLSVIDLSKNSTYSIFPNPANDILNIRFNDNNFKLSDVTLYNNLGQSVLKSSINISHPFINVSSLSQGLYTLEIKNEKNRYIYKVVIK